MNKIAELRPNTIDPTGARSFPSTALETRLLVELFADKPEGTTITYKEMEDLIGRPVTPGSRGYGYLTSARRILLRDHNVLIDSEPKVGMRVCTDQEKLLVSNRDMKRGRRAFQRGGQKLQAVEYDKLTDDQKREWNARASLYAALELLAAPAAVPRVERAVSDHALPSAKTLELFRG